VQQHNVKLRSRTCQSIPGSISTSLISNLAHLGVLLRSYQSNIGQRTESAESFGASPSSHAHLCQNGMQAPCQAHTPAGICVNLSNVCSTQSVVMTCHTHHKLSRQLSESSRYHSTVQAPGEVCMATCTHHSAPAHDFGSLSPTILSCMLEITSSQTV